MKSRQGQQGLSLIEVMIAMTIGAVMTVGMVQLFVANSETAKLTTGQARMQENARFAFEFIGRSIQQAGYRGCFSNNDGLIVNMDANFIPYEFDLRLGSAIQGFAGLGIVWQPTMTGVVPYTDEDGNDTGLFYQSPVTAAEITWLNARGMGEKTGINLDAIITGTDVLVTRFVDQQDIEARLDAALGPADNTFVVYQADDGYPDEELHQHQLAMIHDCEKGAIFKVTSIDQDNPAVGQATVGKVTGGLFPIRNENSSLTNASSFSTDASVAAIESHTYFIAPGAGENDQGNTPLSLWRKSGLTAPVELVEGVEQMLVFYGEDVDADGTPDRYVRANEVSDWQEIKTVRVTLVVNSVDDVGGTSTTTHNCVVQGCYEDQDDDQPGIDGLIRRTYTQTFKMRNPA